MQPDELQVDVLVAGAGNAGLCAAISALEGGASVLLLERSPKKVRGGNTAYTVNYRFAYERIEDLAAISPIIAEKAPELQVEPYPAEQYYSDLMRLSEGRADDHLMSVLAANSYATIKWLSRVGVEFEPNTHPDGLRTPDGKMLTFHGRALRPSNGGTGIVKALFAAVRHMGGEVAYDTTLIDLFPSEASGSIGGAVVKSPAGTERILAKSIVLATGGFNANPEMRAKYLGPGWDTVKVRGTRYNTGDGLEAALKYGAGTAGEWSGCHATMVHASSPAIEMGDEAAFPHAFPFGILVNRDGLRFVDEGADFYDLTYATLGQAVLRQPGGVGFQVFDSKASELRRTEWLGDHAYSVPHYESDSLEELARVAGIDSTQFVRTVQDYNEAVQDGDFSPSRLDGKETQGLLPNKSNWAQRIDTPPYEAFAVDCGLTFTYGGLRTDEYGAVQDRVGVAMPGLYAVGEVAGTFFGNYVGGTGLTKGAVFGRAAGIHAARHREL